MTRGRSGLTLLEVIVSMAIFMMSIIAIFQLLGMGTDRAEDVRLRTRTSMRCQGKLAEVMTDPQQLVESDTYTPFDDSDPDKNLSWKVNLTPYDDTNRLYTVRVSVKADLPGGRIFESTLTQMIHNPAMRGTTSDVLKPLQTEVPTGTR